MKNILNKTLYTVQNPDLTYGYQYLQLKYFNYNGLFNPLATKYNLLVPSRRQKKFMFPYKSWNVSTYYNLENYLAYNISGYQLKINDIYSFILKIYYGYAKQTTSFKDKLVSYYLSVISLEGSYYKAYINNIYNQYLTQNNFVSFDITHGITVNDKLFLILIHYYRQMIV